MSVMPLLILLAAEAEVPPKGPDLISLLLPPLAVILVLYLFMDRPGRRDRGRREQLLKNLKKNDRVVTIGGMFGSVVNISPDGKEVTLKVDDSTRIKFRRTAIADVLSEEPAEPAPKST
jgi:preprotein translocase subunit YajC